jgi:antitoxin (DNA-binding transcriptional repressor) of toxin-antitoxin stability system
MPYATTADPAAVNLSIGDAKSRFSEILSRALAGERFVIHRRNRIVAAIIGPDDFEHLASRQARALSLSRELGQRQTILAAIESGALHPAAAAYGLLSDAEDLDTAVAEIYRNRRARSSRPAVEL